MIKYLAKNRTTVAADGRVEIAGRGATSGYAIQAIVNGTGAVTATVPIEVSNDGNSWSVLTTMAPSGTNIGTAIFSAVAPYVYIRANTSAITGSLDVIVSW